uniref:Uncharacterized protein n=1 Tax=Caenorhabditis japonica TaxID=281687 RepID=A0A8R1I2K3_CAEJA
MSVCEIAIATADSSQSPDVDSELKRQSNQCGQRGFCCKFKRVGFCYKFKKYPYCIQTGKVTCPRKIAE